ncbi:MAG: universal stress protein [Actinomycetota bacterium]|nr:universal stress protein [Actinomycetota bacterium]
MATRTTSAGTKVPGTRVLRATPGLCAKSRHAGLVVLSSRGRAGIAGWRLGSVSYPVLYHARCPVLIAQTPDLSGGSRLYGRTPLRHSDPVDQSRQRTHQRDGKWVVPMRRMFTIALLVLALGLTGCAGPSPFRSPGSPSPSPSPTVLLKMPDVVGQNADVALDQLHKQGFTNVDLGTVDGHRVVVLPQNWTVKTQSAKAGTRMATDAKIVLGCARIGDTRWI